ncbi:MAG: hypothetical protein DCC65_06765 [Planctomycetota bacterium]|nr:MAG: hypothetical protein DCC65_06765 [Planctomycetota bacterium]
MSGDGRTAVAYSAAGASDGTGAQSLAVNSGAAAGVSPARSVDELFAAGHHYGVLQAVLPMISAHGGAIGEPERIHAALLGVKSYVALGLIGPALELLSGTFSPLAAVPEFEPLRRQLAAMPTGQIPWVRLSERFERNAARLYAARPELREYDEAFRAAARGREVFWAADGNVHISERGDGGARRWLSALCDHAGVLAAVRLPHDPKTLFCPPYAITGDYLGGLFRRVFDATAGLFMTFAPRVYVVEAEPEAIGLCLYVEEDVARWCHERVSVFTGGEAAARLEAHLLAHPDRSPPEYCLRLPYASTDRSGEVIGSIRRCTSAGLARAGAAMERMKEKYSGLDARAWGARLGDGRPLRILGITSRFTTVLQYSMRDVKAAFERLGHAFEIYMEPTEYDLPTAPGMAECIERARPDMLFVIDHHRREYAQTMPADVPFVCWVQDALPNLTSREAGRSLGPLDFFISADPDELVRCYGYPRERGLGWSLATNARLFSAEPVSEERLAAYRCDFSFVSNQSTVPEAFHREYVAASGGGPSGRVVYEYLYERLRELSEKRGGGDGSIVAGELIADLERDTGLAPSSAGRRDHLCRTYIHPLSELFFRQRTLEWVADFCDRTGRVLHLYGHGWEKHPRFARYSRGVIENGEPLRGLYQASRINLQIIGSGAVHQRLLDGLAAGGFFLVRAAAVDRVHEACARVLGLVDAGMLEPGRSYEIAAHPDVAAAICDVTVLVGVRPRGTTIALSEEDVATVRSAFEQRGRRFAGAVFGEDYDRVWFADRARFEALAERYLPDADARRAAAAPMREMVLSRFTYDALARDLLVLMRARLAAQC